MKDEPNLTIKLIWKRKILTLLRFLEGSVHSTKEKFENGALLLQFILNRSILKTPTLRFSLDRKHFENAAFQKRWFHNRVISLLSFRQRQIQNDRLGRQLIIQERSSPRCKHRKQRQILGIAEKAVLLPALAAFCLCSDISTC